MPLYLYQASYTPESLAAQIKKPADRLKVVAGQLKSAGIKFVAGGYSFGDYDFSIIMDAPDDVAMASVSIAITAGGAVHNAKTTRLFSGAEYVEAMTKSAAIAYKPQR